jgi:hypothetical protein
MSTAMTMLSGCVLAMTAAAEEQNEVVVGAIRWDAWAEWEKYKSFLYPEQWRYRLPFYAKVRDDGSVEIRGDRPEVMAQELEFAHNAGIDYWAWVWYDPTRPEAAHGHMNDALDIYRAHPARHLVDYCLVGPGYHATQHWGDTTERFVAMFSEPNYKKVLGGRPLFYYLSSQDAVPHFGSVKAARGAMDYLRAEAMKAGLGDPYIVGLCFWPDKGAQAAKDCGFDAIGSYCNPPGAEGRELEYEELAGLNRWFWEKCKETGLPVVPPLNAGWDPRPRRSLEHVSDDGNWCYGPTPEELQAHVTDALVWVRDHPAICEANTILIYAWNEFDEGGWICPTWSEGTARLDAIQRALESVEPGVFADPGERPVRSGSGPP